MKSPRNSASAGGPNGGGGGKRRIEGYERVKGGGKEGERETESGGQINGDSDSVCKESRPLSSESQCNFDHSLPRALL